MKANTKNKMTQNQMRNYTIELKQRNYYTKMIEMDRPCLMCGQHNLYNSIEVAT